jgi:TolB-like protein/Tfp pilus assembly protein PilF
VTDASEGESESTWARLTRRKVVQWGIAYAAGAWGLLQGLAYVGTAFHWPEQLQRIAILAFVVGLPIVLILAWYHGDRREQRISRTELAILTLLFLLGGGLFWRYQHASETVSVATPPTSSAPAAVIADDHSIAVLPFVDMSQAHDQEYFSDGISEELLNLLAQVPELRVIARTSSFAFKGKEADIAEIARKLNVAHVLEGSVRKSGNTLRITAQLIRTSDSSHLWSQTYDRQLTDVFKVQDEIAAAVVSELKIKLLGAVPKLRTTDPQAYALFLQAREVYRQSTPAAMERAIALYNQALAIDPTYAPAWVGLADVYVFQVNNGLKLADAGIQLAREATGQALALDPESAPAHAQLGWMALFYDRDSAAAARHIERALALEPANLDVIYTATLLARRLGRLDQAIALGKYQISRDPVSTDAHVELANTYRYAGRLDEALAEMRTVLSLNPGFVNQHELLGEVLLQKGDAKAALTEMQREANEPDRLAGLSMAYYALGQKAESDAALADVIKKYEKTSAYTIASALAFTGQADRSFAWLDKALRYHDPALGSLPVYPMFANVHSDPRWLPFLRRLGMAPEQLAAIKFDVTVPK